MTMSVPSSPHPRNHARSTSLPAAVLMQDMSENAVLKPEQAFYDAEAQKISDEIDEELKRESQARRDAKRKTVKVMLLGQAESGKSTLQKQFQLYYASQTLDHERPSWKPVVHFNIVRALRMILDELDYELSRIDELPEDDADADPSYNPHAIANEIAHFRATLLPLVAIEASLASELNGGVSVSGGRAGVFVRSGWLSAQAGRSSAARREPNPRVVAKLAARTLLQFRDEVDALWHHAAVRRLLKLNRLRLEESAPFFLDNLDRISQPDYIPDTNDILNVRLQTLGVTEHALKITMGGTLYDWRLYDVGGARGQRQTWMPYFDDATAIIFLAPISAFDQYLDEDLRTNRIDDSLQLFTTICTNKLLIKAHLVLMLNKTDLLRKKLEAGIKVKKYITSYGNRPNRYEEVSEYFRGHFIQVHRRKDIGNRTLYAHFTSMLDVKTMQKIIINVGEVIIRQHISQTGLV